MQPLVTMPLAARAAMRGVLADIDDTLSTRGRITAQAYAAMENLRAEVGATINIGLAPALAEGAPMGNPTDPPVRRGNEPRPE